MGLAGPKTRRKLDYDPNNTRWSRDETTFGQKILRAQGWEPGKFLGARDSTHSDLLTAASSAPIKVTLKDDTLGLGAKPRQKQNAECTGLDGFKDLLGRLNGKSEETIKKERKVRSDIKTSLYVERRYGPMRFVSGGLLVGDQMQDPKRKNTATSMPSVKEGQSESEPAAVADARIKKQKKEKKSKKRKAEEITTTTDSPDIAPEKKRKKGSKNGDSQGDPAGDLEAEESSKKKKRSKKSKRDDKEEGEPTDTKKKSKKSKDGSEKDLKSETSDDKTRASLKDTKSEKSGKKREKKRKQLGTTKLPVESAASTTTGTPALSITPQESGPSTPTGTGTSTPQALTRHYVRSRNIASKRMAMADMQALNQIFMVKPV
ncbi:hypothetical protein F4779DRAFT_503168 [Xylariaceae sp. FL0662B]|nr:hypothetical protein F4779DRAFT_503168 [Xylariaceae sp. FL0662B]